MPKIIFQPLMIANPQNTKEVRTFFNDGLQIRRNA